VTREGSKPGASPAGAGRVIAGSARGIRLVAPAGTRPLGDRAKEALFAILQPDLREAAFLDLFAGSGAAGIEALSRGASRAVFVDRDRAAADAIRRNLRAAHVDDGRAEVVRADVAEWLAGARRVPGPFDVVFVDPPYEHPELLAGALTAIESARPGGVLASNGVLVAKHDRRERPEAREGLLASVRERRFGETALTFHRWRATAAELTGEEGG
jgi:16S rRNA (guanine(966)-N(2))-methyltransferase RsmD